MIRFHLEKSCKPDEGHLCHPPERQLLCPDSQSKLKSMWDLNELLRGEGHSRADSCLRFPNKQIQKDENFGVPTGILTTYLSVIFHFNSQRTSIANHRRLQATTNVLDFKRPWFNCSFKMCLRRWDRNSIGRVLGYHAQSHGFDPGNHINLMWSCKPSVPELRKYRCRKIRSSRSCSAIEWAPGHAGLHKTLSKILPLLPQMSGWKITVATGESVYTLPDILDLEYMA